MEGPLLAIKSVNSISHYTEWTISHVHSGALGWVSLISFGALYHMIPELWAKEGMYSKKLINIHLWCALIGIILYVTSMWAAGVSQGLGWREYNSNNFLQNSFIDVLLKIKIYYVMRVFGGLLFFIGVILMSFNSFKTITMKTAKYKYES